MKHSIRWTIILLTASCTGFMYCGKGTVKKNGPSDEFGIPYEIEGIEKKYLTEGFISDDTYRIVIVAPKESGHIERDTLLSRARQRARVSLERSLAAEDITCDRNTRAAILDLIEQKSRLYRADIEHRRYEVYYYDITKKNMKNYLREAGKQF